MTHSYVWWIDRYRKSTAYTRMSLAAQGAYHNIMDEVVLRGGVVENDDDVLAAVCGRPKEWKRVRLEVLARFILTSEGWRHETIDKLMAAAAAHAKRQGRFREKSDASRDAVGDGGSDASRDARRAKKVTRPPNSEYLNTSLLPTVEGSVVEVSCATPKSPTKALIDHWRTCRSGLGLGPEKSAARHAAAFADLWGRCDRSEDSARAAITAYFASRDTFTANTGYSIGEFQRVMDRSILEAKGVTPAAPESRTARLVRESNELFQRDQHGNDPDTYLPHAYPDEA